MASQKPWELFVSLFCSLLFEVPKLRLIILSLWQQGCTLHTLEGSMRAHHGVRVQSLLVSCLKDCCGQRASLLFGTGPGQAPSSAVLSLFLKSTPQNKTSKQQQQKPNNNPTEAKKNKNTHAQKKKGYTQHGWSRDQHTGAQTKHTGASQKPNWQHNTP